MNKKKFFKIIGITILIVVVMLLIYTIRNFIIIKNLKNNFSKYENSQNYHITSVAKPSDNTIVTTMNYYKKNDKQVVSMERKTSEENLKLTMYDNGERVDMFIDNEKEKTCRLGVDTELAQVNLVNYLETENDWQTFLGSFFVKIHKKVLNQKECYVIENFSSPLFMYDENKNEVYLEKDTGLMIKSIFGDVETDREYEFDNVDDGIFVEPNVGEYRLLTE